MRALVSKCGTAMAPLLIFAALGRVLSTRCPTPASDAASMRFTPWSYSRRNASQKSVTPKTPVQPLSTDLRLAGSSRSAFTTSAPTCLNVFAASESGRRGRQRTSGGPRICFSWFFFPCVQVKLPRRSVDLPGRHKNFKLLHNREGLLKIFPSPHPVLLSHRYSRLHLPGKCLQMGISGG